MPRKTARAAARKPDPATTPMPSDGTGTGKKRRGPAAAPPTPPLTAIPIAGGGLAIFGRMMRRPMEWIIPDLVPRGELILSAGRSATGKSTWLAALVAHMTGGLRLQGGIDVVPTRALLYGAEADPHGEALDRLEAAGADLDRCVSGDELPDGSAAPRPYLPEQLSMLRERIEAARAGLVVIDPLTSYLSAACPPGDPQGVRHILLSLQQICRDLGTTICAVAHNRKSQSGAVDDWVSGTKEWWNVPRWILCHAVDPKCPGQYVLAVGKHSRSGAVASRTYRIEPRPPGARLVLCGETATSAEDLGAPVEDATERSARIEAKEYLQIVLSDGERRMKDLLADAVANGVSVRTLRRAASELGVTHHHIHVQGDVHWVWRAPEKWPG